ncbi:arginine--tRNA ligase [Paenibacillus herberti]|uniref:Arginine--tRNA ligase n=1 Tax=Paenibacillus herberti TaxID=1619309 RepID=A0A229NYT8_9BACL|nr:arginine--tRNA ligase [Paenibacillus herberti]OXM14931.1 arginine--tRNA ligase [Paenibacillus herberti]
MTTLLKQSAAALLAPLTGLSEAELAARLEYPPEEALGDLSFPCFPLAKTLRQAPNVIAAALAARLNSAAEMASSKVAAPIIRWHADAAGGFLNLKAVGTGWMDALLREAESPKLGQLPDGAGKRVIIDYSSPNIAKPFGVGHLRSTVIGRALANLHRTAGWDVVTVNHLGDWGTQFGKLIAAYKHWGDRAALEADPIGESLKLYVRFHEEAENAPELVDEGRAWFRRLEQGDAEARELWDYFIRESLKEFQRIYSRLGVSFDHLLGESFYNDKMEETVDRLRRAGLLEASDGASVVRLDEEGMPPCLILKSDGSTIYGARDLATALYRREQMRGDKLLYVVGAEQTLHFRQVFRVLEKLDASWSEVERVHTPFGLMKMEGKKMSTRRGKVVFLEEVLDEAKQRALAVIEGKTPDLPGKEDVAEAVGTGAIVFGDLRNRRMLEVDFNLEEMVSMEGETGPYLQYTHARARSLLRRAAELGWTAPLLQEAKDRSDAESGQPGECAPSADASTGSQGKANPASEADSLHIAAYLWPAKDLEVLDAPAARACLLKLGQYSEALRAALREHEPSVLARYLLELAKAYNRFYNSGKILGTAAVAGPSEVLSTDEDAALSAQAAAAAKLRLSAAAASVLRHGLTLLGIGTPNKI